MCIRDRGKRIDPEEPAKGTKWYAYMEYAADDPWFNNHPYVDTLRPEAIGEFIEDTHEVYRKHIGECFGGVVPAIFTDEPQFTPKDTLRFAQEEKDVFLPWTDRLPELYNQAYAEDLFARIPELLWELPGGRLSPARWRFQNLITDLFVASYCRQIGDWCAGHGLSLTAVSYTHLLRPDPAGLPLRDRLSLPYADDLPPERVVLQPGAALGHRLSLIHIWIR